MQYDKYGQSYVTEGELCELLYNNPKLNLSYFNVSDPDEFNSSVAKLHAEFDMLKMAFLTESLSVEEFDAQQQANWHMPQSYKDMDIAEWVLSQCKEEYELQRVGQELLMYHERNLFDLLRYLKYFVDTMRANKVVWGVGRGSSVASYVLFLIGVHKINSLFYSLDISEFLK